MRYMLLIYGDEAAQAAMSESDRAANMKIWFDYTDGLVAQGIMRAGDPLDMSSNAKLVRGPGEGTVTDGPFAETREQLGGYYLLECDEAQAVAAAKACPAVAFGGAVEVRAVWDMTPRT